MAKDKKSFVAYCDWLESFEELTDEEAGRLAKHLFRYVNDLDPEAPDKITKMCFIPIKQSLKRDLVKYEERAERARLNGAKGGRPKTQKTQSVISEPKKPDSDNVSVSVSDNGNVSTDVDIPAYEDFKEYALDKCSELNFNVPENSINAKYQSWKANGWRNGNGKKIKNWKTTILNTLPYLQQKETIEKIETKEEREAREMMEEIKRQAIHESLYGNNQIGNV
jgi:hypothetical protein